MNVREHLLASGLFLRGPGRSIAGRVDATDATVSEALGRWPSADRRLELWVWLTFNSLGEPERIELKSRRDDVPDIFQPNLPLEPPEPPRWPVVPMNTLFGVRELGNVTHVVVHAAQVLLAVDAAYATAAAGVLLLAAGALQHLRHASEGRIPIAELPLLMPPPRGQGSRAPAAKPALQVVAVGVLREVGGFLRAALELLHGKRDRTAEGVVVALYPAHALARELLALYEERTAKAHVLRPEVIRLLVEVQGRVYG